MAGDKLLKGFLDLMDSQGWILRLRAGADKIHPELELPSGTGSVIKQEESEGKVMKREGKVGERILSGRPFLAEALAVSPSTWSDKTELMG